MDDSTFRTPLPISLTIEPLSSVLSASPNLIITLHRERRVSAITFSPEIT